MPNAPKFAIGIEPKQAIEFLRQKKMLASKVFTKELHNSALAKATIIARLSSLEMTKDIYQSLENAMREGKGFHQWKKELVGEFERKGWIFGKDKKISQGIDGNLIADPKTGEYFGTPRRLNTIYRVNMQSAYSSARYQRLRDNVDNRPYWQYSAVGDSRTRPAHLALSGKVYRYDDPFWATFYPPNGFNCRCTVIALSERDLARKGMNSPDDSSEFLVEVERPADKHGNREKTIGFKLADGSIRVTDKGFDYNVGRLAYKPNLDLYPKKLAHQFAKVDMTGGEFKQVYRLLEDKIIPHLQEYRALKSQEKDVFLRKIRSELERNFKFAAGVLTDETKQIIGTELTTVWLSDDSLVKQIAHREGQFGVDEYVILPEILFSPEKIKSKKGAHFEFYKTINGTGYVAVIKVLEKTKEIYMQSFRKGTHH
ncbi:phage minor head protein [Rodentibacter pneumotropicus]|uniref:phage minor head protein n=1 Tax=Rodentibacter pneumotropicus TaxID=758 RepID=UPI00109D572E|nr:phage minor head protein [Rodentibacter pneumotropicus]NBH76196.1 phage head morphogenesis protein [Rodentibacter pneumotropicus]THA08346.1 phage head morphogenesis protein [Rodentibacter pneumotropicus]THA12568.1 phage head morphogenesis protein [Rodentibacter pneumotropicus]